MKKRKLTRLLAIICLQVICQGAVAADISGYIEGQQRWFPHDNQPEQDHGYTSVAAEPALRIEPAPAVALTLRLFGRKDFSDDSRTHADVREAMAQFSRDANEYRIGVGDVFWGVAESRHLVDIINQQDFLERFDGEARLGQPMLAWTQHAERYNFDLYMLPGFREREFPKSGGRLRSALPVTSAHYESGAEENHVDVALRGQLLGDGGDIALAFFRGTSREPLYSIELAGMSAVIRPLYPQLEQWSLEGQQAVGNLLLKLEAVHRDSDERSWAVVGGGEYTWPNVWGGDLGLVVEYLKDTRDAQPTETFQDDIFAGVRFASSSLASTELLAGIYQDRKGGGRVLKLEASTRLGEHVMLTLEAWRFDHIDEENALALFARDDFVELGLRWHFD